jgi:hypothetical protein
MLCADGWPAHNALHAKVLHGLSIVIVNVGERQRERENPRYLVKKAKPQKAL